MNLPNQNYPIIQIKRLIEEGVINQYTGKPMKGVTECVNKAIKSGPCMVKHHFSNKSLGKTEHMGTFEGFIGALVAFDDTTATIVAFNFGEYNDLIEHPEHYRLDVAYRPNARTGLADEYIESCIWRVSDESEKEEENEK